MGDTHGRYSAMWYWIIGIQGNQTTPNYLDVFTENTSVKRLNLKMLQSIEENISTIPAKAQFAKNIPHHKIIQVFNRNQSETGGLARVLDIKMNERAMLTVDIDLQGKLINGQWGTVKGIHIDSERNVSKVYTKFDDFKAGWKRISSDALWKR